MFIDYVISHRIRVCVCGGGGGGGGGEGRGGREANVVIFSETLIN